MATTKIAKKLPKRVTNERLKARRQRSWQRGEDRKTARRTAQEQRERANRIADVKPWNTVKAAATKARTWRKKDETNQAFFVNQKTDYPFILRYSLGKFGHQPGMSDAYLYTIHTRWQKLGKLARAGRL